MNIGTLVDSSPFIRHLGISLAGYDAEQSTLTMVMPLSPAAERGGSDRQFHGGAIAGLADTAGTFALIMTLNKPVATINLRTDFLRPAMRPACAQRQKCAGQVKPLGSSMLMFSTIRTVSLPSGEALSRPEAQMNRMALHNLGELPRAEEAAEEIALIDLSTGAERRFTHMEIAKLIQGTQRGFGGQRHEGG
jgi:uncharacterized protein (TIGR00369 family)